MQRGPEELVLVRRPRSGLAAFSRLVLVCSVMLGVVEAIVPTCGQANLPTPVRLTNDMQEDYGVHLAASPSGAVMVVWGTPVGVKVSRSLDGGLSFGSPATIAPTGYVPRVAFGPGGMVVVSYGDTYPFVCVSTDGGAAFGAPSRVGTMAAHSPVALAVDGFGRIHVAWVYLQLIRYSRSDDGGATFAPPITLNSDVFVSANPALAADPSGNPHAVWLEVTPPSNGGLRHAGSADGGLHFGVPNDVTVGGDLPSIACGSNGDVHVAWNAGGGFAYARSVDQGLSFSPGETVLRELPVGVNGANYSSIAARDSEHVVVSGVIYSPDNSSRLHIGVSQDGGRTLMHRLIASSVGYMRYSDACIFADGRVVAAWDAMIAPNTSTSDVYAAAGDPTEFLDAERGSAPPRDEVRILALSPNPAGVIANLVWSAPLGSKCEAKLFDAAGRSLRSWSLGPMVAGDRATTRLQLGQGLPAGLYLLRVDDGMRATSARMVVLQ